MGDTKDLARTIGANIRAARHMAGLTIRQLAARVDTGEADVGRWERGQNLIRVDALLRIAKELDVSTDSLLGRPPVGGR